MDLFFRSFLHESYWYTATNDAALWVRFCPFPFKCSSFIICQMICQPDSDKSLWNRDGIMRDQPWRISIDSWHIMKDFPFSIDCFLTGKLIYVSNLHSLKCCTLLLVALFEENLTRSSKSRFIGVFEPNCHVKSIVGGERWIDR